MDDFKKRLGELKRKIAKKEEETVFIQNQVKKIISLSFGGDFVLDYIKEINFKNGKLSLFTKNKAFSSELFLKKEELKQKLPEKIRELVIK